MTNSTSHHKSLLERLTPQPKVRFKLLPEHQQLLRSIKAAPNGWMEVRRYRGEYMPPEMELAYTMSEHGYATELIVTSYEDAGGWYTAVTFSLTDKGKDAVK